MTRRLGGHISVALGDGLLDRCRVWVESRPDRPSIAWLVRAAVVDYMRRNP